MPVKFVGRTQQLDELGAALEHVVATGHGTMMALRGRRQVGKSRLVTEFVRQSAHPHVFFTAIKNASLPQQMLAFQRDVFASTPPLPDATTLFSAPAADWTDLWARVQLAARSHPLIVVLDEVPWAIEKDETLEGRLQAAWDRDLQHQPILLLLIGSDLGMMERLTAHDRPLYGRAKQLLVRSFSPGECSAALGKDRSAMDVFDSYLVTGGYPRLVEGVARAGSANDFVRAGLADENSDFVVVAQRSLDAEFPPDAQARRVLSAIGSESVGHATYSTSVARMGDTGTAAKTAVARGLEALRHKGVVAVDTPYGASEHTKTTRYRVDDPYLRLWLRFVEPQLAAIARGRADVAIASFEKSWTTWRGTAIEPVAREALSRLFLNGVGEVGGWWNRDNSTEVDVVAGASRGITLIGSIKWRERKAFSSEELRQLAAARSVIPGAEASALVAICPAGLEAGAAPDLSFDADTLLAAWEGANPG